MNYNLKLNLLKFKNSAVVTIKGKESIKKGIFIPIDDNNVFISEDDSHKAKGAYIDGVAWENQTLGKYGDTHSIRQSLPKDVREKMTEDQLKLVPYFGNMKPYESLNASDSVSAPVAPVEDIDDLPF